jgi:hypothetical protein
MFKKKKSKTPKIANPSLIAPSEPKSNIDNLYYKKQTPVWQISKIDNQGKWGWSSIGKDRWEKLILPHLISRETMTWAEIENQKHGSKNKSCNHEIAVSHLCEEAKDRLYAFKRDDCDELFSLRVNGKTRIFGNRDGRVFQIFWFDFEHEICPTTRG